MADIEQIAAFREQAKALLPRIPLLRDWLDLRRQQGNVKRAFIIEFAGMPKAGKSSAIDNLRHFFSHGYRVKIGDPLYLNSPIHRYEVHTPAEGVSMRTPSILKGDHVDYNTWAGAYGIQELLQAAHDTHNDLVILDRGPWDAGCWLEYWIHNPELEGEGQESVAQIAEFFQLDHWMTRSDLHVVLVVDPETAAEREQRSRLIEHGGFASNRNRMEGIKSIYTKRFERLRETKASLCTHVDEASAILFDSSDLHPNAVTLKIINAMFELLEKKIHYHAADFALDEKWVQEQMSGYLRGVRGSKKKLVEFLPAYVAKANALKPVHRIRLAKLIEASSAPADLNVGASGPKPTADVNPLQEALAELLRKVQAT